MTQSKHTSGPWVIDNEEFGQPITNGIVRYCPPYGGGGYITIADCSLAATGNNPEWQANARLIAAAPELLEALEQIIQPTMINGDKQIKVDWQQLAPGEKIIRWESAKKTIAKARGK